MGWGLTFKTVSAVILNTNMKFIFDEKNLEGEEGGGDVADYLLPFLVTNVFVIACNNSSKLLPMDVKKRRPNWSERELTVLAEAIIPRSRLLKVKFSPSVTTERKNEAWKEIADQ